MSAFPTLRTGAVMQYPAQKQVRFATEVLRFMDGSEQRFREYPTLLRRWVLRLDLLDQGELHQLREFFRTEGGATNGFTFTDPWDGVSYANCSIEGSEMLADLVDEMRGKTALSIRQNRG